MIAYGLFYLWWWFFADVCGALYRLGPSLCSDLPTASSVHIVTLNINVQLMQGFVSIPDFIWLLFPLFGVEESRG